MGIKRISDLPELTEAAGDETVVGTSGNKVVRIPVGAIGGSDTIILRSKSTMNVLNGDTLYNNDGSSVVGKDIYDAFLAGTNILICNSLTGNPDTGPGTVRLRAFGVTAGVAGVYYIYALSVSNSDTLTLLKFTV